MQQVGKALGNVRKLAEELVRECQTILNKITTAENRLHTAAGQPLGSDRWLIVSNPPTLEQLKNLGGKLLAPFVKARSLKNLGDKDFQAPKRVGTVGAVKDVLRKLEANPNYALTPTEDSWLLRAQ